MTAYRIRLCAIAGEFLVSERYQASYQISWRHANGNGFSVCATFLLLVINGTLPFQSWKDEFLTWNPLEYNGTQFFMAHNLAIWTPKLILLNS